MFHKTFFFWRDRGLQSYASVRKDGTRHFYDPSLTREILRLLWWGSAAVYDEPFTRVEP